MNDCTLVHRQERGGYMTNEVATNDSPTTHTPLPFCWASGVSGNDRRGHRSFVATPLIGLSARSVASGSLAD